MIIVIVLVVVFVLVITVVVCCVKRQRNYRQERLKKKDREVRPKNSNPCGISFQEKDGANGEEMDLKEFDNEAVRFDEDMNAAP
jgi:predicted Holliday junction resolvase-like endonuclease